MSCHLCIVNLTKAIAANAVASPGFLSHIAKAKEKAVKLKALPVTEASISTGNPSGLWRIAQTCFELDLDQPSQPGQPPNPDQPTETYCDENTNSAESYIEVTSTKVISGLVGQQMCSRSGVTLTCEDMVMTMKNVTKTSMTIVGERLTFEMERLSRKAYNSEIAKARRQIVLQTNLLKSLVDIDLTLLTKVEDIKCKDSTYDDHWEFTADQIESYEEYTVESDGGAPQVYRSYNPKSLQFSNEASVLVNNELTTSASVSYSDNSPDVEMGLTTVDGQLEDGAAFGLGAFNANSKNKLITLSKVGESIIYVGDDEDSLTEIKCKFTTTYTYTR